MDAYQIAKEEIKRAANITELIGQYVQLKKTGKNFIGLCPFHSEKAPSFTVTPSKQIFHCFGCKKGGDIFSFWMEYHKTTFPQAMKDLAEKYNVTLPERELTPSQRRNKELKEALFEINELAAKYYNYLLKETAQGKPGRDYLKKREIGNRVIDEFKIGYAPDEWDNLTKFLEKRKVDLEKVARTGLIIPKKTTGYYDRFRGRVIFPIHNLRQQVTGFGGRVLDDSLPKYLNSPETPVFSKGELLYGLHLAFQSIKESGRVVIVEGYTDVLALNKHGFKEAVATLGTALTTDHIRKLKGYVDEAIVVFDSDSAGRGATIKSLPLFLNEGLSSRVIVLPEGDDPDTFINKKGLEGFFEILNQSVPMFEFFLDQKLSEAKQGIEGQANYLKEILPVLSEINSYSLRSLYIKDLSERCRVSESIILNELQNLKSNSLNKGNNKDLRETLNNSRPRNWDDFYLMNLLIHAPQTTGRLYNSDCRMLLSDPVVIDIFDVIFNMYENDEEVIPSEVLGKLNEESTRERFREAMVEPPVFSNESLDQALKDFEERIHRIKLSESLTRKGTDLEEKNRLLMLKRDKQA